MHAWDIDRVHHRNADPRRAGRFSAGATRTRRGADRSLGFTPRVVQLPALAPGRRGAPRGCPKARGRATELDRRHARADRSLRRALSPRVGGRTATLGANRARTPKGSSAPTGRFATGSGRLLRRRRAASRVRRTGARSPRHRRLGPRRPLVGRIPRPAGLTARRVLPHDGCYRTTRTNRQVGPLREHAPNGNGITFAAAWFGGKILRPAAVTGLQLDDGKLPASTIRASAVAVPPFRSVTVRAALAVSREAARPSWRPARLTADTPGYPASVHRWPERFVNSMS
jgi:hypothetical protein